MNLSNLELQQEQTHLDRTLEIIRSKISELGQQLYDREEKLQEFQKFIWDTRHAMDPTEMKSMVSENELEVTLMMYKGKYYQKLFKVQNSPYFGSIVFKDNEAENKVYIGITHVEDEEKEEYLVHDWRAPICSLFYDYEIGPAEFKAPEGIIKGTITNKRQFKIEQSKLKRVFDNNINIDDELLQEVLAKSSSDKMKNIVNTIQQEQNAIIRNTEDKVLIVQGIAGSGKTSVALHRIAFLLYKIENLTAKNVLIFSPNKVFSEYISNVLPELGEDNTKETTFNDFLNSYIKEFKSVESFTSFVERYYKYEERNKELVKYKQSDEVINHIDKYIKEIIKSTTFINDYIHHDFDIKKEELNNLLHDRFEKLPLFDRISAIAEKYARYYYNGNKTRQKSIESNLYRILNIKKDYKQIYKSFFNSKTFTNNYKGAISNWEITETVKNKTIRYEDACLFLYLKMALEDLSYEGDVKEIVIDEAQDYNRLQYILISKMFKRKGFTLLGDINQTINPYYKYESLNDLSDILDKDAKYLELSKTYRSSPEIIEHTNKILGLQYVSAIRHANNNPVLFRKENKNLKELMLKDIKQLKEKYSSVAIITKTDEEAERLFGILKNDLEELSILTSNADTFNKNMVILPVYIAKGLEFDSTVIYTEPNNKYKQEEKYLYYVACTRSQHQLIIYNQ